MTKITGFVLAAVLSVATPVSAISIDLGVNATGSAQAGSGVSTDITSQTHVGTGTHATSDSEADITAGTYGETITITPDDLDDAAVTITSSAAVSSHHDLDAYARGVVKTHADIRDVALSETTVSVSHRAHARILGLIPTTVFARAEVKNDGTINVKYPWYAFAAQKKAALESKVKASVQSIPSVSANLAADAKLSSTTQAEILEKTVAVMKAEFDADAAAKAEVN